MISLFKVDKGLRDNVITVSDNITSSETIHIQKPSWFEKLRGITWEDKVNKAIQKLTEREKIVNKFKEEKFIVAKEGDNVSTLVNSLNKIGGTIFIPKGNYILKVIK